MGPSASASPRRLRWRPRGGPRPGSYRFPRAQWRAAAQTNLKNVIVPRGRGTRLAGGHLPWASMNHRPAHRDPPAQAFPVTRPRLPFAIARRRPCCSAQPARICRNAHRSSQCVVLAVTMPIKCRRSGWPGPRLDFGGLAARLWHIDRPRGRLRDASPCRPSRAITTSLTMVADSGDGCPVRQSTGRTQKSGLVQPVEGGHTRSVRNTQAPGRVSDPYADGAENRPGMQVRRCETDHPKLMASEEEAACVCREAPPLAAHPPQCLCTHP